MSEVTEITCEALDEKLDDIKTEAIVDFSADDVGYTWRDHLSIPLKEEKRRSDVVAQQMGNFLLKGYKMLATSCPVCHCILMEDRKKQNFCIGCQLDKEKAAKEKG